MNESENNGTVKTALDALAFLKSEHSRLNLPAWAIVSIFTNRDKLQWGIYGNPPGPYRFVSAHGDTVEEAHANLKAEMSTDKLRAEIEKLQAQLAQVEGGVV